MAAHSPLEHKVPANSAEEAIVKRIQTELLPFGSENCPDVDKDELDLRIDEYRDFKRGLIVTVKEILENLIPLRMPVEKRQEYFNLLCQVVAAAVNEAARCGRCGEFANVALVEMWKTTKFESIEYIIVDSNTENGNIAIDHQVVVKNRKRGSDINDPTTWGDDVTVINAGSKSKGNVRTYKGGSPELLKALCGGNDWKGYTIKSFARIEHSITLEESQFAVSILTKLIPKIEEKFRDYFEADSYSDGDPDVFVEEKAKIIESFKRHIQNYTSINTKLKSLAATATSIAALRPLGLHAAPRTSITQPRGAAVSPGAPDPAARIIESLKTQIQFYPPMSDTTLASMVDSATSITALRPLSLHAAPRTSITQPRSAAAPGAPYPAARVRTVEELVRTPYGLALALGLAPDRAPNALTLLALALTPAPAAAPAAAPSSSPSR